MPDLSVFLELACMLARSIIICSPPSLPACSLFSVNYSWSTRIWTSAIDNVGKNQCWICFKWQKIVKRTYMPARLLARSPTCLVVYLLAYLLSWLLAFLKRWTKHLNIIFMQVSINHNSSSSSRSVSTRCHFLLKSAKSQLLARLLRWVKIAFCFFDASISFQILCCHCSKESLFRFCFVDIKKLLGQLAYFS